MNVLSIKNPGILPSLPANIRQLLDRKKAEMAVGISDSEIKKAYSELPALAKTDSSMLFIPSAFKAGKIFGIVPKKSKNLLMYSERFDATYWRKIGSTITSNAIANPIDGLINADLMIENTALNSHQIDEFINPISTLQAGTYTASIYVKAFANRNFRLKFGRSDNTQTISLIINTTTGAVINASSSSNINSSHSVINVGNGWWRVIATATFDKVMESNPLTNSIVYQLIEGTGTSTYTGDGTSGVYLYGAQLEKGATATTYVGTNTGENLLKYSEQFDNSVVIKANCTITPNTIANPIDGAITADKLVDNGANTGHQLSGFGLTGFVIGTVYSFSVYAKAAENNFIFLQAKEQSTTYPKTYFNLSTGVVSSVGAGSVATIDNIGNGWYRCSITFTADVTVSSVLVIGTAKTSGVREYIGNSIDGVYLFGAQLNYGSIALPYTKTTYSNTDGWVDHTDFTFSRASNAMVVGSDGLLQYAPHNLLQRSEEFDNAIWSKGGTVSVSSNQVIAPDGTLTGDVISFPASFDYVQLPNQTIIANQYYTASVYVKRNTGRCVFRFQVSSSINSIKTTINSNNQTIIFKANIGTGVYLSSSVIPINNEWDRYIFTGTLGTETLGTVMLARESDDQTNITAWGIQLNVGTKVTDYVQTTTTAIYAPRFQYNPVTLAYEGLLMEKASTNLLTYSEQFDNAAYIKNNTTISVNQVISPDGTLTADKIVETIANGNHQIYQDITSGSVSQTQTFSVYLKAAERNWAIVQLKNQDSSVDSYYWVNLSNGSLGTVAGSPTTIVTPVGNGWYRCSITKSGLATATRVAVYATTGNSTVVYAGNTSNGIYIWGAQLEASSVPTSYIPTLGSTATRAIDALNNPTPFPNTTDNENTTVFVNTTHTVNDQTSGAWFRLGNSILRIANTSAGEDYIEGAAVASGGGTVSGTAATTNKKAVIAIQGTGLDYYVNGTYRKSAVLNSWLFDQLSFVGVRTTVVKSLALFPTRRSNAELQQMTS